jgi:hypothetical protein
MKPSTAAVDARPNPRLQRLLAALFVAGAFCFAAMLTWQRWGDIIVDCGRELDTPKQLLAGKVLYRDVRYWYGPLAPYVNALLYRVFGVHVSTLSTAGLASAGLLVWLGYRIVRLFAGRCAASSTAVALVFINCFAQIYGFNLYQFPLPYAYPATYGLTAAAASLYFLLRHVRKNRPADFLLSCLFLSLTVLCKLEMILAALVLHGLFVASQILAGRRLDAPRHVLGYLAAIGIPAVVYGYFYVQAGPGLWFDNLFIVGNLSSEKILLTHSGLKDIATSLRHVAWSAVLFLVCTCLMWLTAEVDGRAPATIARPGDARRRTRLPLGLLAGLACGAGAWYVGRAVVFRAVPLLLLIAVAGCAWRFLRRPTDRDRLIPYVLLFGFALACLVRTPLRAGAEHYGFYLFAPAVMALGVLLCRSVPSLVARRPGRASGAPALAGATLLLTLAATHAWKTREVASAWYGPGETPRVRTAHGSLPLLAAYRHTVDEAVRFLSERPPQTKVVVLPEGVGITFLSGCTNALGVHTYLPVDFCGAYDDPAMVRRLQEAAPDYIVFNSRDLSEYGKRAFGLDYAVAVAAWVNEHYRLVRDFHTKAYVVRILERVR